MRAELLLKEKRLLLNRQSNKFAIAELRIWRIPRSKEYPAGIKYSLFLVYEGTTIVGFDNHKPKGPHVHLGELEMPYQFVTESQLLADFWDLTRKAGFEV